MELIKNINHGEVLSLADLVQLEKGRVNSRTLSQMPGCKMTVFAIDEDEGMSSHSASGDAFVYVLEGIGEFVLDGTPHQVHAGECLVMSAGTPHSVRGITPFKMLLVVVKPID